MCMHEAGFMHPSTLRFFIMLLTVCFHAYAHACIWAVVTMPSRCGFFFFFSPLIFPVIKFTFC